LNSNYNQDGDDEKGREKDDGEFSDCEVTTLLEMFSALLN